MTYLAMTPINTLLNRLSNFLPYELEEALAIVEPAKALRDYINRLPWTYSQGLIGSGVNRNYSAGGIIPHPGYVICFMKWCNYISRAQRLYTGTYDEQDMFTSDGGFKWYLFPFNNAVPFNPDEVDFSNEESLNYLQLVGHGTTNKLFWQHIRKVHSVLRQATLQPYYNKAGIINRFVSAQEIFQLPEYAGIFKDYITLFQPNTYEAIDENSRYFNVSLDENMFPAGKIDRSFYDRHIVTTGNTSTYHIFTRTDNVFNDNREWKTATKTLNRGDGIGKNINLFGNYKKRGYPGKPPQEEYYEIYSGDRRSDGALITRVEGGSESEMVRVINEYVEQADQRIIDNYADYHDQPFGVSSFNGNFAAANMYHFEKHSTTRRSNRYYESIITGGTVYIRDPDNGGALIDSYVLEDLDDPIYYEDEASYTVNERALAVVLQSFSYKVFPLTRRYVVLEEGEIQDIDLGIASANEYTLAQAYALSGEMIPKIYHGIIARNYYWDDIEGSQNPNTGFKCVIGFFSESEINSETPDNTVGNLIHAKLLNNEYTELYSMSIERNQNIPERFIRLRISGIANRVATLPDSDVFHTPGYAAFMAFIPDSFELPDSIETDTETTSDNSTNTDGQMAWSESGSGWGYGPYSNPSFQHELERHYWAAHHIESLGEDVGSYDVSIRVSGGYNTGSTTSRNTTEAGFNTLGSYNSFSGSVITTEFVPTENTNDDPEEGDYELRYQPVYRLDDYLFFNNVPHSTPDDFATQEIDGTLVYHIGTPNEFDATGFAFLLFVFQGVVRFASNFSFYKT